MVVCEIVDGCQLKCTLCWNRYREGSFKQIELSTVEKVIKKYGDQRIDWFNWGEPLFHKNFVTIAEMIKGTKSGISTNFSFNVADNVIDAMQSFHVVVVSISGITPDVYGLYHHGGKFEQVMENIKRLASKRRTKLVIRWLGHKDNAHQLEDATKYFTSLGYIIEPITLNCEVEELIDGFTHSYVKDVKDVRDNTFRCKIIHRPTIGVDGQYYLCCASHNIPIGYTIDDNISSQEMLEAKMNTDVCRKCREGGYWRMFN